jgi:hypothetical protein
MVVRPLSLVALLLCCGCLAGCGTSEFEITQLQGVITLDGQPLPGVYVQFNPDPEAGTKGPSSFGESDAQGRFTLRYALPAQSVNYQGVVVGSHRVTVADMQQEPVPQGEEAPPSRIPEVYRGLHTSPLRIVVKPGMPEPVLEVKASP